MKGLLFTCYHGHHSVQALLQSGLFVKQSTFNHLGKEYCVQCWYYVNAIHVYMVIAAV